MKSGEKLDIRYTYCGVNVLFEEEAPMSSVGVRNLEHMFPPLVFERDTS